jgi:enoyl-CoA hydratase
MKGVADQMDLADVIVKEHGRAGLVRLNRAKALNAVTLEMIRALEGFHHACAKAPHIYGIVMEAEGRAFSAGGDIRALYSWDGETPVDVHRYYAEEYQHCWTLECFTKPNVALIDGVTMGGGLGICLYGTHRVAGENARFSMPETGIGFFPDIGGGWFLPRLPGKTGLYLGLTGAVAGQADAFHLGLATHCISARHFETIKAAMVESDPIDPVLDRLHEPPGEGTIMPLRPAIDRLFAASSVEDIIRALDSERGEHQAFARVTLEALSQRSRLSLKIAFEQLRRGTAYRNLKEALVVEYRIAMRLVREPDFREGIRAAIIDKAQAPKWAAQSLQEVSDARVLSFFEPLPEGDLELTDYWTLVA